MLKRLLGEGQVIEGSLSCVTAGSAAHWHLTRKVNGRTQTLYVPMSSVEEVREWIRRWKEAKGLVVTYFGWEASEAGGASSRASA